MPLYNPPQTQSNQAFSADGGSSSFQTLSFSNANGLSFSNNAGQVQGSYTVPSVPAQTAFVLSDSNGISFGTNGSTVTASYTVPAGGGGAFSAGGGSSTFGTLSFSNANGVSFSNSDGQVRGSVAAQTAFVLSNSNGLAFGTNGSTVTGSYTVPSVTNSSWTLSDTATSLTISRLAFTNSNGLTLTLSTGAGAATVIGSYTVPTLTNSSMSISDAATSGTLARLAFTNQNGITLSLSTGAGGSHTIVGSHNALTSQSGQAFSAGGGSSAFQTLSFSNANGLSFSNNAGQVQASYTVPTVTNSSWTLSDAATSVTISRLAFTNSNGLTLSLSTGAGAATVIGSYTVPTQSNQQMTLYATGNTTQSSTGTSNASSLIFRGSGAASVGITNGSVLIDVAAGAAAITQSIGMSTQTAGGATGGTTGYVTGDDILYHFVAGSNITLSQSVNGASGTLSIYGAAGGGGGGNVLAAGTRTAQTSGTILFSNSNGITFGLDTTAGSVMTASFDVLTYSGWHPYRDQEMVTGQVGQGTLNFNPISPPDFQCDRIIVRLVNTNSSNSSGSHTISYWVGLYSKNASSMSRVTSTSTSLALTHSGTAGSYSLYSGMRIFTIPFTTTISAGDYWLGVVSRTTSGGANGSYSQLVLSNQASNFMGHFGSSHNTTCQITLGQGVYSATTSGIPQSVAFTEIRGSDSMAFRAPLLAFASGTI